MRLIKGLVDGIATVMLVLGVIYVALFLGVRLFGLTPYGVTSNSMAPMYPKGSAIYVRQAVPEELEAGDVITFYMGSNTVATHQIHENDTDGRKIWTQGINNRDSEGNILVDGVPVEYENVVGVVVFGLPYLGYVNQVLANPPGLYYAVGAVLAVVLLSTIVSAITAGMNKKQKHRRND